MSATLRLLWEGRSFVLVAALAGMMLLFVNTWRGKSAAETALKSSEQRLEATVAAHTRAMAAVTADAVKTAAQRRAIDQQKSKVIHAQTGGVVPDPIRAALDGVRALRSARE